MPIFGNSWGGLEVFISQNKVEDFFIDHFFEQIFLLHTIKVEDLFLGHEPFASEFLAYFGNGKADNILGGGGGRSLSSFTLIVYSDRKYRKSK